MKKVLLIVLLSFFVSCNLFADPVDAGAAMKVARNFLLQATTSRNLNDLTLTLAYTSESKPVSDLKNSDEAAVPVYYVFNVSDDRGFVIVSGDDDAAPVLGYSTSGSYPLNNLPPALRKMLEKYRQEILYMIANNLKADEKTRVEWQKLETGDALLPSGMVKAVNPLLQTIWNQFPYENQMCPADPAGPGGHCVTGCPATTMSQIMKYWNYPASGMGFHSYNSNYGTLSADFASTTYNWAAMPNQLTSVSQAVSLIMYQCGVAVEMTYGPDGSYGWVIENDNQGNHPVCCEVAYKTYFGYASTMNGIVRAGHTDAEWKQFIKTDLDAGRPVQYAGFGQNGGHTWVCDGYNNDYFHMNWGWGGQGDGYYYLDALNPGNSSFNANQQALFGIQPGQSGNSSLTLYSTVTVNPATITYGQGFSVNADIVNNGAATFQGDYAAALFNEQGTFVDFVQTLTGATLEPGYHYNGGLTFTSSGIAGATPGNYIIGIYARPNGGGWTMVAAGSYTNPVNVQVQGTANNMELYDQISVNHNPIIVNQSFTATTKILNSGSSTFYGSISLDLHASDGTWLETIQEYNNLTLQGGYYFDNVPFTSSGVNVAPGTYYLVVWDKPTGGEWAIVSNGSYTNPIAVTISGMPLNADVYEANNSEGTASVLAVNFSGFNANCNSNGSNIHNGTDVDYYRVDLPAGNSYSVNARVHDSYNSGNGNLYTGDVMFSYKEGASAWSDSYDDVMPGNIILLNGGVLTFWVSPYFPGLTGTYLLDLNIVKSPQGVDDHQGNLSLAVFPNPAKEVVKFRVNLGQPTTVTGNLYNVYGQKVANIGPVKLSQGEQSLPVDVRGLVPGCYTYMIQTTTGHATGKLVVME